jgi:hypothetical protein
MRSPYGGVISASPNNGAVFSTQFRFTTYNWMVETLPASFQYYYMSSNGTKIALAPVGSQDLTTVLPMTSKVYVKCIDNNGAYAY